MYKNLEYLSNSELIEVIRKKDVLINIQNIALVMSAKSDDIKFTKDLCINTVNKIEEIKLKGDL